MEDICRVKGISRQAHYQKRRREEGKRAEEEKILTMVRMIRVGIERVVDEPIELYNEERPHQSLGMRRRARCTVEK